MIFQSILYDFPQAAYLLLLTPFLIGLFWYLYHYRRNLLEPFLGTGSLLTMRKGTAYWIQCILFCLAWIFAVLALMQPKGNERYPSAAAASLAKKSQDKFRRKAHDVIFLIDASASMSVKDARSGITRFDNAKDIADEIMRRLRGENGSLHAFTSETMQLSPLTLDYLFLRIMLRQVHINEGETSGTNILQALEAIQKQYFSEPTPRLKTLILFTDGDDTQLEGLKGTEREQAINKMATVFSNAEKNHLRVFTVGVGSKEGQQIPGISYEGKPVTSALQEDLLQKLSDKGRGRYYFANDYSPMQIAGDIMAKMTQDNPFMGEEETRNASQTQPPLIYDHYFQYPLALAILCLVLALLIPQTTKARE